MIYCCLVVPHIVKTYIWSQYFCQLNTPCEYCLKAASKLEAMLVLMADRLQTFQAPVA